jgi:hypothetical protein
MSSVVALCCDHLSKPQQPFQRETAITRRMELRPALDLTKALSRSRPMVVVFDKFPQFAVGHWLLSLIPFAIKRVFPWRYFGLLFSHDGLHYDTE